MARVIITLLDSFGIGWARDAAAFGDKGSDTLGHIVQWMAENRKNPDGSPRYLALPNLAVMGLETAHWLSTGEDMAHTISDKPLEDLSLNAGRVKAAYTCASEVSKGKDTLSGHWEIAGVPVDFEWGYFPDQPHCFPQELVDAIIKEGNLPGVLGEKLASGTEIIKELGEEHMRTGKPIIYSSADSVLQIACHEESFGLERLYDLCKLSFELVKPYKIARVIARPFVGTKADDFQRVAAHRHDYAVPATRTRCWINWWRRGATCMRWERSPIFSPTGALRSIIPRRGWTKYLTLPCRRCRTRRTGPWCLPILWILILPSATGGTRLATGKDWSITMAGCRNCLPCCSRRMCCW